MDEPKRQTVTKRRKKPGPKSKRLISESSLDTSDFSPASESDRNNETFFNSNNKSKNNDDRNEYDDDEDDDDDDLYTLGDVVTSSRQRKADRNKQQQQQHQRGKKKEKIKPKRSRGSKKVLRRIKRIVESSSSSSPSLSNSQKSSDNEAVENDVDDEKIVADMSHQQQSQSQSQQQQQSMCVSQREVEVVRPNGRVIKLDSFDQVGFVYSMANPPRQLKQKTSHAADGASKDEAVSLPQISVDILQNYPVCFNSYEQVPNYVK